MPTVNLLIKGKVQGAYYQVAAKEEAEKSYHRLDKVYQRRNNGSDGNRN